MIDLKKIEKIYFIGIGGIGMSALARYFKSQGKQVSGYDKTETSLTKQLMAEGIAVHYRDAVDLIPKGRRPGRVYPGCAQGFAGIDLLPPPTGGGPEAK